MKLTDKQKSILAKKLTTLTSDKCPICGGQEWLVNDTIFELREFHGGSLTIGGGSAIIPLIAITCSQCGNALLFNALSLGLLAKEDEQKKK